MRDLVCHWRGRDETRPPRNGCWWLEPRPDTDDQGRRRAGVV
uniref:Uncharacterized protein n=1 Tax=Arundo donax TaxID=35708 RepID=A0A0A9AMN7_ARUDO